METYQQITGEEGFVIIKERREIALYIIIRQKQMEEEYIIIGLP